MHDDRSMTCTLSLAVLALMPVLAACAGGDAAPRLGAVALLEAPTGAGSGEPNLFTGDDGTVYLSWLEPEDTSAQAAASTRRGVFVMRFAALDAAGGWSAARTIARGDDFFVNWADFPSLVEAANGDLVAHWLQRTGENTYAYAVRTARSTDAGTTWSAVVTPHNDATPTEHGFVSLLPRGDGSVDAIWLDGRKYADAQPGADGHGGHDAEMTLRYAVLLPDGGVTPETEIDARVCDCCQTAAARAAGGLVVAYRDRSPEEIRDVAVVRQAGDGWSAPQPVHADNWKIDACPVNGPSIAARGEDVALAWFTAARDTSKVQVAFSSDGGATFGAPVRVDDGNPSGRVDVELLSDGSALVLWLERTDEGAAIRLRRVSVAGRADPASTIAVSSSERASGFPRMVLAGERVVFAWTEAGANSRVRVASAALE